MRHFSFIHSVVVCILVGIAMPSQAETVNSTSELLNNKRTAGYVFARSLNEKLYKLGVEQDRKFGLQLDCKTQYRVEPYSVSIFQPIDFPDDKQHPTKGVWNFRYQLQRCGDSKFYNVVFIASGTGESPPQSQSFYPGNTNADPVLIKDAMPGAVMNASLRTETKDCKDLDVFDMKVTQPPHDIVEGDRTHKGVWKEVWTLKLCGQMVDVGLTFVPDPIRGGIHFATDPVKPGTGTKTP